MIVRLMAVLAMAWALGFALFMLSLAQPADGPATDAIVVLTGASGRLTRGLALLADHKARRLLVTGVAPNVRPIDLANEYHVPSTLFDCCVDLGREAVDTRSNAEETARWMTAHRFRSVRLVTSDWHMARARMELENALADDIAVLPDGVPSDASLWRLLAEYNKLIVRRVALWLGLGA